LDVPLLCRLLIAPPVAGSPPVEPSAAGYRPVPVVLAGVDEVWAVNTGPARFVGLEACTVVGVLLVAGPGGRGLWAVRACGSIVVPAGGEVLIPAGVLRVRRAQWEACAGQV
jgi:hypothetical protein